MAHFTTDGRTETIRRLTEHRITKIRRLFSTVLLCRASLVVAFYTRDFPWKPPTLSLKVATLGFVQTRFCLEAIPVLLAQANRYPSHEGTSCLSLIRSMVAHKVLQQPGANAPFFPLPAQAGSIQTEVSVIRR
jgi:hypothetical protein